MRQQVGTAPTEAFRQARPLAEGQKSADVKHDFIVPPPPPPTKTVGGGGRISREKCRLWCLSGRHLAEGVLRRKCYQIGGDFCKFCTSFAKPQSVPPNRRPQNPANRNPLPE